MKRALAVIPARGGSKRVARKNLRDLGGKPLVAHTIEAALQADCFTDVLVSSDDPEIRAVGAAYPGVTTEDRASEWASDTATVFSYIAALVAREDLASRYDVISLLLPTAPFRRAEHVKAGFSLLEPGVDAVVSVSPYEFPPQFGVLLDEATSAIRPFVEPSPLQTGKTRSQDQARVYHPNGAFYFAWWRAYASNRSFYLGKVRGCPMTRADSVDIDDEDDLAYAQYLWGRRMGASS
jgi:CMP-N-acetylneuraminic acid synthetase